MRALVPCLSLALLAACHQTPDETVVPKPTASQADVLATVAALPPRQRDGVLFRAIRDAGHDCQEVGEVKPQPANAGTLAWLATCDRREQWLVAMDRTGTAQVIDARTAAAAAR